MTDHELIDARSAAAADLERLEGEIAARDVASRNGRIAQVRQLMAEHGLTLQDIGGKLGAVKQTAPMRLPMYRNDSGQTWAGRGKRPDWLRAALANGMTLEQFRIAA